MRSFCILLFVAVFGLGVCGCAVYSEQKYGPQNLGSTKTLTECMTKAGGPDLMHSTATNTVCVYRQIEAMSVLGIYGYVDKKDRVLVFDKSGAQISDDVVNKGKGMFVLGSLCPVWETE